MQCSGRQPRTAPAPPLLSWAELHVAKADHAGAFWQSGRKERTGFFLHLCRDEQSSMAPRYGSHADFVFAQPLRQHAIRHLSGRRQIYWTEHVWHAIITLVLVSTCARGPRCPSTFARPIVAVKSSTMY